MNKAWAAHRRRQGTRSQEDSILCLMPRRRAFQQLDSVTLRNEHNRRLHDQQPGTRPREQHVRPVVRRSAVEEHGKIRYQGEHSHATSNKNMMYQGRIETAKSERPQKSCLIVDRRNAEVFSKASQHSSYSGECIDWSRSLTRVRADQNAP